MREVAAETWSDVALGEIVTLHYGKALPRNQRNPHGTVPVYGANGVKDTADLQYSEGPTLVIGRKGSAGQITRVDGPFWPLDVTYFTSHDTSRLDFDFLHYILNNLELPKLARGVKPGINRNDVYSLHIPLPPLEEQRRIVAILDEAFEDLDRARAHAEANLENVRELLMLQIEHELAAQGDDWTQTTIAEVCSRFEYGTSSKSLPSGQMPVLRMGNLQGGEIDWSKLVYSDDADDISKFQLRPLDVLFNRTNSLEHVGKAAIYRGEQSAIFAGYLIRLHYKRDLILPEFLNLYLNSKRARDYGRAISGKSVNQANISASKLKTYPLALPLPSRQAEIVERVENMRGPIRGLEDLYRDKLSDFTNLRQSLLQRAFAGELT